MSVTVTLRIAFSAEKGEVIRHPAGKATLVDGRGQLLVLSAASIDLTGERGVPETELLKRVIATYADGEWSHAKVGGR